ncbi:MAG: type IV toxin-antitoxin system AbiEi family antitoxin domain-containing protein [Planctomycetes bacterium]|nr:type IV toxin-antitoxin system AbiEi family antitoxin domain-containing protein [Planctomycetota bacterium]
MPKRRQDGAPEWARLYEMAEPQGGYVTTAQAHEAGYSNPLLNYYVREGRLKRAARGIYRLAYFPAGDNEDLVVVWLWSGQEGVFSHETALALYELSDALPHGKHLSVPSSWRPRRLRVPRGTELYYADIDQDQRAWAGPVPVTKPLRTVVDCAKAESDLGLVEQAIEQGLARGLFGKEELRRALVDEELHGLLPMLRPRTRGRRRFTHPGRVRSKRTVK